MWIPAIRAQMEINHGNAAKAVELLKSAQPCNRAYASILRLRSRAFFLNRQFKEAESEFLAALKLKSDGMQDPNAWLAQLDLARTYAGQGDTSKARTAYQDFLASWKDADPGLTLLTPPRPNTLNSRNSPSTTHSTALVNGGFLKLFKGASSLVTSRRRNGRGICISWGLLRLSSPSVCKSGLGFTLSKLLPFSWALLPPRAGLANFFALQNFTL